MRATEVSSLTLDAHGVVGDRRWMVVDAHGKFVTQRTVPAMATFTPLLEGTALRIACEGEVLQVEPGQSPRAVTVWKSTVDALDCGERAAQWLSERLKAPVRLVTFAAHSRRSVNVTPAALTTFTDGFPLLITNEASLDALNASLAAPVPMNRFRPNLVVRAEAPWVENRWARVHVDGLRFDGAHPCGRCVVITTDQQTGSRPDGSTPLTVLHQLNDAKFGMNLVHRGEGTVHVGAEVEVVSK